MSLTFTKLSIVIPVLDEAQSLPALAQQVTAACDESDIEFEVILVDDGSSDSSWEVIQALNEQDERFQGLRFRRNYGKSAALAVGFEAAQGEYVLTMDADLQDDPAEIPKLLAHIEEGYDLVSGWKRRRRDPLGKVIPSRFFNFVTRQTTRIPLHDFNCGLKIYRSEVVKAVRPYGELHRYIPLLAKWEGFTRISEIPVNHRAREFGRTKFGFERYVRGFLDFLTVTFLTRFAARPMHFFGTVGTLAFAGGFVISLLLSIDKVFYDKPIGDRPLLMLGVLMILVGSQMFLTGLLGEMVIRSEMETTDGYQISDSVGVQRTDRYHVA